MKFFFKVYILLFCFQVSAQVDKKFDEGLIKFLDKDFVNAKEIFTEVIKLDPKNYESYYYVGVCNIKLSLFTESIINFDDVIKLNPKYAKAYYNRGVAKFYLSMNESGCSDFRKAVEVQPGYDDAIKAIMQFCKEYK
jgi:tetratricopeptide (TPR) repeat protein